MRTSAVRGQWSTSWLGVVLGTALFVLGGCGGSPSGDPEGEPDPNSASTDFSLTVPPGLGAGSVRICGERESESHGVYPCRNDIRESPDDHCPCFDLDSQGIPRTARGDSLQFSGLCPSDNVPEGPWIFGYELWTESGCAGEMLNAPDNPNNFRCFDIEDLVAGEHVNQSVEWLSTGSNHNQILCLSRNSTKDWEFQFCEDRTELVECGPHTTVLGCGCELVEGQCVCRDVNLNALPWNCTVEPANGCDVWCEGAYPIANARFTSFGNAKGLHGMHLGAYGQFSATKAFTWKTSDLHDFEWVYDDKKRTMTLSLGKAGTSSRVQLPVTLATTLPTMDSIEIRLVDYDQLENVIEIVSLSLKGKSGAVASNLLVSSHGSQTHRIYLGPIEKGFTLSGRLRIAGPFPGTDGNTNSIELTLGRNYAAPPGPR